MVSRGAADPARKITEATLSLLESEGYDAVQLRRVARVAQVSLTTVYKLYPTRDELVLSAMAQWMATNTYTALDPPRANESLADVLKRLTRYVFEPWERHPQMLAAYYHARSGPGGQRLDAQGFAAVLPAVSTMFASLDEDYVADLALVLTNMIYALLGRFAHGHFAITEILPALERAIGRLTQNNAPLAAAAERTPVPLAPPFEWTPGFSSPFLPGSDTDAS
ncbi:TetR family transcriptional regulator [Nocardia salmonicida]|uniref:TetR family transcriptional regulator n=1 Tax=Nocardia TaxID=1817 RepID=UPI00265A62D5|nr:TetR family transcriptional regulator [Nocardia sp. PE-7]WKG07592.1 TetR family transcriptional regulator [Nocardia sp. PE-7]